MAKDFDIFLIRTIHIKTDATLRILERDKHVQAVPNSDFAIMFFYTLGIPKADPTRDFGITWKVAGVVVTGNDAPNTVSIVPTRPQHTRVVNGETVDIGHSEMQTGIVYGITPNIDKSTLTADHDIEGAVSMYQPDEVT